MSIVQREAPVRQGRGRPPRLTPEDLQDIYNTLQVDKVPEGGIWAGDDEPAPSRSSAYQRAGAAVTKLGERYKLTNLTTNATPVDPEKHSKSDPHYWNVGRLPAGSTPRGRKRNGSS